MKSKTFLNSHKYYDFSIFFYLLKYTYMNFEQILFIKK
jgi:hypothetical protein